MKVNMCMMVEGTAINVYEREAENVHAVTAWRLPKIPGVYPDRIKGCSEWASMGGDWVCIEFLDGSKQEVVNNG